MDNMNDFPNLRGAFLNQSMRYEDNIFGVSSPIALQLSPITPLTNNSENNGVEDVSSPKTAEKYFFDSRDIHEYLSKYDRNLMSKIDIFFEDTYLHMDVEEYLKESKGNDILDTPHYKRELCEFYSRPENIAEILNKELDINFDIHLDNQRKIKEYAAKKAEEMVVIRGRLDKLIEQYNSWKESIKTFLTFVENNNNCERGDEGSSASELKNSLEKYQKEILKKMDFEAVLTSYAKVHAELSGIRMFVVKYTNATEEYNCPICKSQKVRNVLVPCGHTYCESCISQLKRNLCPLCRKTYQTSQKIYFN
jgi:hypothetical protein